MRAKEDYKHYYRRKIFFVNPHALNPVSGNQNGNPKQKTVHKSAADNENGFETIDTLFSKQAMYSPAMMAEVNRFRTACDKLYTTAVRNCRVSLKAVDGTGDTVTIGKKCRGIKEGLDLLDAELQHQNAVDFEQKNLFERSVQELNEKIGLLDQEELPSEHLQRMYERKLHTLQLNYEENSRIVRENKRLLLQKQLTLIQNTLAQHDRLRMVSKNCVQYYFEQIFRSYYRQKKKSTRKEERNLQHLYKPDYSQLEKDFFRVCPETEENIRHELVSSNEVAMECMRRMFKSGEFNKRNIDGLMQDLQQTIMQTIMQNEEHRKISRWEELQNLRKQKERELKSLSSERKDAGQDSMASAGTGGM